MPVKTNSPLRPVACLLSKALGEPYINSMGLRERVQWLTPGATQEPYLEEIGMADLPCQSLPTQACMGKYTAEKVLIAVMHVWHSGARIARNGLPLNRSQWCRVTLGLKSTDPTQGFVCLALMFDAF